jgi:hypothetical protein
VCEYNHNLVIDAQEVNEYDWSFTPYTWTHIVMTYDGLELKAYIDGEQSESGVIPWAPVAGPLYIGGVPQPDYSANMGRRY